MTDYELLEKAARAAGFDVIQCVETENHCGLDVQLGEERPIFSWNPLNDDGEALRLAVKLKIFPEVMVMGYSVGFDEWDIMEDFTVDQYAATRRAIVRAAATMAGAGS